MSHRQPMPLERKLFCRFIPGRQYGVHCIKPLLARARRDGNLKTEVASIYPLADLRTALAAAGVGGRNGKVCSISGASSSSVGKATCEPFTFELPAAGLR
ncbi:hypothetical protein [Paraburkholderia humisilvae]|nr:hypothetical protein [Paraburkholderia humisilvae]